MSKIVPKNEPAYYARLNQLIFEKNGASLIERDLKAKVLDEKTILSWKVMLVKKNNEKCLVFRGSDNLSNWLWNFHFVKESMPFNLSHDEKLVISQISAQVNEWKKHHDIAVVTGFSSGGYLARRSNEGSDASIVTFNALKPEEGQNLLNFRNRDDIVTQLLGKQNCILLGAGGHRIDDVVKNCIGKSWRDLGQGGSTSFIRKVIRVGTELIGQYGSLLIEVGFQGRSTRGRDLFQSAEQQVASYRDFNTERRTRSIEGYFTDMRLTTPSSMLEEISRLKGLIDAVCGLESVLGQSEEVLGQVEGPLLLEKLKEIQSRGRAIDRYANGSQIFNVLEGVVPGLSLVTSIFTGWSRNKAQKAEAKIERTKQRLQERHNTVVELNERNHQLRHTSEKFVGQLSTKMHDLCIVFVNDPEASTKDKITVYEFLMKQQEERLKFLSQEQASTQLQVDADKRRLQEAPSGRSRRAGREFSHATSRIRTQQDVVEGEVYLRQLNLEAASIKQELGQLHMNYLKEQELHKRREVSAGYARWTLAPYIAPNGDQQKALAERNQADYPYREAVQFEGAIVYRLYQNFVNVAAVLGQVQWVKELLDSKSLSGGPNKIAEVIAQSGSLLLFYNALTVVRDLWKKFNEGNIHGFGAGVAMMEVYFPIVECLTMVSQGVLNWKNAAVSSVAQQSIGVTYKQFQSELQGLRDEIMNRIFASQSSILGQMAHDRNRAIIKDLEHELLELKKLKNSWFVEENINQKLNDYLGELRGTFSVLCENLYNGFDAERNGQVEFAIDVQQMAIYPELFSGLLGKIHGKEIPNGAIYRRMLDVLECALVDAKGKKLCASAKDQLRSVRHSIQKSVDALSFFSNDLDVALEGLVKVVQKNCVIHAPRYQVSEIDASALVGAKKFRIYRQYACDPASTVLVPKVVSQALYPSYFMWWGLKTHKETENAIQVKSLSNLKDGVNENLGQPKSVPVFLGVDLKSRSLCVVKDKSEAVIQCDFSEGKLRLTPRQIFAERLQTVPFDTTKEKFDFKGYTQVVHQLIKGYQSFITGSDEEMFRSIKQQCAVVRSHRLDGIPLAFPTEFLNEVKEKIGSSSFWMEHGSAEPYYQFSRKQGILKLVWSGCEVVIATFDPATIAAFRKNPLESEINETEFLIQAMYAGFAPKDGIKLGLARGQSYTFSSATSKSDKIYLFSGEKEFEGLYKYWVAHPKDCVKYSSQMSEARVEPLADPIRLSNDFNHLQFYELNDDCMKAFYVTLAWIKFVSRMSNPGHFLASECDSLFQPGLDTKAWKKRVISRLEFNGPLALLNQQSHQLLEMIDDLLSSQSFREV